MKTIEQVNRYLSKCKFSSDDWGYMRKYLKGKYNANFRQYFKSTLISTIEQYMAWEAEGIASGEVVTDGDITGIVSYNVPGSAMLAAYITDDDGFVAGYVRICIDNFHIVTNEERAAFLNEMGKLCYTFNDRFGIVTEKMVPKRHSFVHFSTKEAEGCGVVLEVKDLKLNFVFAVVNNTILTNYSVNYIDTNISHMTPKQGKELKETLKNHGYTWNEDRCTLEKLKKRASVNEKYWYITDKFSIRVSVEKGESSAVCNVRYNRGNYFTSLEEAVQFLEKIMEFRGTLE